MGKNYPSDISGEQFEPVLPIVESARKTTMGRTMELDSVFYAVLYLLR